MRFFELHRDVDETGVSGTGVVAQGVMFDDGHVALRWLTAIAGTTIYSSIHDAEHIHGHGGKTRVVMLKAHVADLYERARVDCIQDGCENSPFACVGGIEKRSAMVAPKWIAKADREAYLEGYRRSAHRQYGEDWETCTFGWAPALVIGGEP
jgi:hypothetical protein